MIDLQAIKWTISNIIEEKVLTASYEKLIKNKQKTLD